MKEYNTTVDNFQKYVACESANRDIYTSKQFDIIQATLSELRRFIENGGKLNDRYLVRWYIEHREKDHPEDWHYNYYYERKNDEKLTSVAILQENLSNLGVYKRQATARADAYINKRLIEMAATVSSSIYAILLGELDRVELLLERGLFAAASDTLAIEEFFKRDDSDSCPIILLPLPIVALLAGHGAIAVAIINYFESKGQQVLTGAHSKIVPAENKSDDRVSVIFNQPYNIIELAIILKNQEVLTYIAHKLPTTLCKSYMAGVLVDPANNKYIDIFANAYAKLSAADKNNLWADKQLLERAVTLGNNQLLAIVLPDVAETYINAKHGIFGKTLLHIAFQNQYYEVALTLLRHNASMDVVDKRDLTPLTRCDMSKLVTHELFIEILKQISITFFKKYIKFEELFELIAKTGNDEALLRLSRNVSTIDTQMFIGGNYTDLAFKYNCFNTAVLLQNWVLIQDEIASIDYVALCNSDALEAVLEQVRINNQNDRIDYKKLYDAALDKSDTAVRLIYKYAPQEVSRASNLLHSVCEKDMFAFAEFLLLEGFDLLQLDANGKKPLDYTSLTKLATAKNLCKQARDLHPEWFVINAVREHLVAKLVDYTLHQDFAAYMINKIPQPGQFILDNKLHLCVLEHDDCDLLKKFIASGFDPNILDPEGMPLLHHSIRSSKLNVAEFLLKNKYSKVDQLDAQQGLPLDHYTPNAANNTHSLWKYLSAAEPRVFIKYAITANFFADYFATPALLDKYLLVHEEIWIDLVQMENIICNIIKFRQVSLFMSAVPHLQPSINRPVDNERNNVAHIAFKYQSYELLEVMSQYGIRVDLRNLDDKTPLHLCTTKDVAQHRVLQGFLLKDACLTIILQNNLHELLYAIISQVHCMDRAFDIPRQETMLHIATKHNAMECAKILTRMGADPYILNFENHSPLYYVQSRDDKTQILEEHHAFRLENPRPFSVRNCLPMFHGKKPVVLAALAVDQPHMVIGVRSNSTPHKNH